MQSFLFISTTNISILTTLKQNFGLAPLLYKVWEKGEKCHEKNAPHLWEQPTLLTWIELKFREQLSHIMNLSKVTEKQKVYTQSLSVCHSDINSPLIVDWWLLTILKLIGQWEILMLLLKVVWFIEKKNYFDLA
jgi:hypothetical protein